MKIRVADYFLIRFCQSCQPLLRRAARWETRYLRAELDGLTLDKPVFVTGLARSGTTLLLELLSSIDGMATHRYRDFPLLMTPYFWNRYLDFVPVNQQPLERAHRDRILITRENPEAMEEPLWHAYFPHLHSRNDLHRLTLRDANPEFEQFYLAHLRKILLIRQGTRYLAKGNYHVTRMEYLIHLFPDAHFVVPIRHPLTHVHSLVRQHQLFCDYAAADPRVPRYLEAAGHFEFGPQRLPIRLDGVQGDRILDAWANGEEYVGYAIQWKELYGFVQTLRQEHPQLKERIHLVRYEDLCADPHQTLRQLMERIEVDPVGAGRMLQQLNRVAKSQHLPTIADALTVRVWSEVQAVASSFHYERDGV